MAVDDEWTEAMREDTIGLPTELENFRKICLNDADEFRRNLVIIDNIQIQCASSLPKPSHVRRSQRIMNSPKKGSVRKEFFDLTLDEESAAMVQTQASVVVVPNKEKIGPNKEKDGPTKEQNASNNKRKVVVLNKGKSKVVDQGSEVANQGKVWKHGGIMKPFTSP